jgi:hypothetical protein
LPVDASDPDVSALLAAYEAMLVAAARPAAAPLDESAIGAAHAALVEAASLLRGAPPAGLAEREYVRNRARAIGDLIDALERHDEEIAAAQAHEARTAKELERDARFQALTELDDRLGPDSIEQLAHLRRAIEGDDNT